MRAQLLVAGACLGLGLAGLLIALVPARPRLVAVQRALGEPPRPTSRRGRTPADLFGMVRKPAMRISQRLDGAGSRAPEWWTRVATDLRVTSSSADRLVAQVLLGVGASLLIPPTMWVALASGGIRLLPFAIALMALTLAALSVVLPVLSLRQDADRRRKGARAVLGSFIDLVVLCLAGGMGVEGALYAAAEVGGDWVSLRIAREFAFCTDSGRPLWDGLDQLGNDLCVQELNELAATLRLAGTEGARVRASLTARSASLRGHEQAEEESDANSMTERLFLPGALLLLGFLLFIGYPAFSRILAGF